MYNMLPSSKGPSLFAVLTRYSAACPVFTNSCRGFIKIHGIVCAW